MSRYSPAGFCAWLLLAALWVGCSLASPARSAGQRPVFVKPVPAPRQDGELLHAELVEASSLIRVGEARTAYGVTGSGLTAAVIDTGIRTTHRDFTGRLVAQVNYTSDNGGSATNATDGDGHGTNVSGIIAANGPHTGMAPGASIAALKVLNNQGEGSFDAITSALDWVIANRTLYNITVVNLSLGDGSNSTSVSIDSMLSRIHTLRGQGVAVCAAAGNDYFKYGAQGMSYPAIYQDTVSVGAVYDANIGGVSYFDSGAVATSTGPDRICPFSQRLHPNVSSVYRTDIFAPGAAITSAGITSDTSSSTDHGTSQATPMVSGIILLLQDYYLKTTGALPTVDQLESWIRSSAVTINDGDDENDNVFHSGLNYLRIDAMAALQAAEQSLGNTTTYSISGTVTASGSGLGGVTMTAGGKSTTTGSDGTYTIAGVAPGSYTVSPSHANYTFTPSSRTVSVVSANVTGVNFTASKTSFSISGTVRTNTGLGLAGVSVSVGSTTTTTGSSGTYSVDGLAAGTFTVSAARSGYVMAPSSRTVTVGPDQGAMDFTATPDSNPTTYSIRGTVTTSTGTGLSGATVTAGNKTTVTGADGTYLLSGFTAGGYTVTATRSGYVMSPSSRSVTVAPSATGVDFVATVPTYTVSGTVLLDGAGLNGVTVTVGSRTTTTDGQGGYSVSGLVAGTYLITPSRTGYGFAPATRTVAVSSDLGGQDFTASVARLKISGRITANGVGVPGVMVTGAGATVTTDSSGAYAFTDLDAGSYTVVPTLAGYTFSPSSRTFNLTADRTDANFTATRLLRISGVVTASGTGLAGITVSAGGRSAVTDASGAYALTSLPAGTYAVTPSGGGYSFTPASRSVTISTTDTSGIDFAAVTVPQLLSLTPKVAQVTGGKATTVVVTFSRAVTATTTITLSSAQAQLKVPKKVVLKRGKSSVSFKATSKAVTSTLAVTVSGSADGVTRETVVTLTPKAPRR